MADVWTHGGAVVKGPKTPRRGRTTERPMAKTTIALHYLTEWTEYLTWARDPYGVWSWTPGGAS